MNKKTVMQIYQAVNNPDLEMEIDSTRKRYWANTFLAAGFTALTLFFLIPPDTGLLTIISQIHPFIRGIIYAFSALLAYFSFKDVVIAAQKADDLEDELFIQLAEHIRADERSKCIPKKLIKKISKMKDYED